MTAQRAVPFHLDSVEDLQSPWDVDPADPHAIMETRIRELTDTELPSGGIPPDKEAMRAHWVDTLVGRVIDRKDTVVIIDGEPGEGKSALGRELTLAVINALNAVLPDRKMQFSLEDDVPYRLSSFIYGVYRSSYAMPRVLMGDELELIGGQARAGADEKQLLLDRTLSVCRIKSCTGLMLIPNIRGAPAFIRDRRAKIWMHVEWRGEATVFELEKAIDFKRPGKLPFKKAKQPFHRLTWEDPDKDPGWSDYQGWKLANTNAALLRFIYQAIELEKKEGLRPPEWMVDLPQAEIPRPIRQPGMTDGEWRALSSRWRSNIAYQRRKRVGKGGAPAVSSDARARTRMGS